MTDRGCATAREAMAAFVRGELPAERAAAVAAHVESCTECRAESTLAALLLRSRPRVPEGLGDRIRDALAEDGPRRRAAAVRRPMWGLLAAAVAALALGIGVSGSGVDPDPEWPAYALEGEGLWMEDDGLVAGAPSLADLSDEALLELLEEWGA